jgi:diguanylate cyclase (GGDEF)-like protein/PAS domain S-box-containing protein
MAQQFLLNNIKTFLSLLGKLEEAVIMHKQDTSIIYANPSAATILGLSEEELLGKSASSHEWYFIDENHKRLEIAEYPVNKLLRSKKNITHMLLGVHSSKNNLKWIDVNGSITFNEFHEPIALITFTDVTSRKEAFNEAELFKNLIEIVDTGITISDPNLSDNPLIYANKAFSNITGYSLEEATHKNCRFLQAQDTNQEATVLLHKAVLEEKACEVILRNYKKDGTLFYNLLNISPFFQEQKLKYFVGVQHDVTKQIEQEQKLQEQTLYIQSILDAQENIVFVSNGVRISYANKALFAFFNFTSMEKFLEKFSCICHAFLEDEAHFNLTKVKKNQNWIEAIFALDEAKRTVSIKNINNEIKYFKVEIKPIASLSYVITLVDITNTLLKEHLLTNKAYHDALTGAYNRQYFYEFIVHETLSNTATTGIIILDIDNFKAVNDTYGHSVGDKVLIALTTTLKNSLRPSDYLIRWGGEEFVVISKTKISKDVKIITENLRRAVENVKVEKVGHFTASFGAAILQENENIDSAIQRADSALYLAKERGKNRVEFSLKI